ncbi:hypothetical protein GYMLUDRAFT_79693 [Collybiopsis luxurians FD-317 M1]|nr:hypothetical protein GYMLUDRAFT_79693 [Collybiopsis luxurians FD-317 M1]
MLETTNLRLRAVRNADFEQLLNLWNDFRVQKTLSNTYVVPKSMKFEELLRTWVSDSLFFCIIETKENSEWVGSIYLFNADSKNRDAMLSIALLPEFWGRGYATEALRFFVDYSFRELGLHRMSLTVLGNNSAAIKLYKKIGFVQEGIQRKSNWSEGNWNDVIFMGILDEEWSLS